MKPSLVVACFASSIAILAACGGAKESDLFGTPSSDLGTDTNGTDPGTSSSGGSSGGTASGSGGTSSGGSTTSSGGSTSSTSSSGGSTSSSSGGSTSSSGGTSTSSSSGGTTTSKGVWCGEDNDGDAIYCGGAACCATNNGGAGPSLECSTTGSGCAGGLAIKCDDKTDCPNGQVCCGTFEENFGYKAVQCATSCNSSSSGVKSVRFCDQNAAVDECLAIGKSCQWSGSLYGYSVCK